MSKEFLGMKWYNLFTKWRPIINIVFTVLILINIIGYNQYRMIYVESILGLISLIIAIIGNVLSIVLYSKSKTKDKDLYPFIKFCLIFDMITISFNAILNSYNQIGEIGYVIFASILMIILGYFIYYRNSIKYFKKRLNTKVKKINFDFNKKYWLISLIYLILASGIIIYVKFDTATKDYYVNHILVEDYDTAVEIIEQLKSGVNFCDLVYEYSVDTATSENCGLVGPFRKGDMVKEFEDMVFILEDGYFSTEPVETEYGYHIIMRTNK